jgi:hypothetical protein
VLARQACLSVSRADACACGGQELKQREEAELNKRIEKLEKRLQSFGVSSRVERVDTEVSSVSGGSAAGAAHAAGR